MAVIFNIFPLLLLCLYPCRCFQRGLNVCRLRRQVLTTFMDTFNGCYRTEPRDYRFFAAFYLVLRIINLALFSITTSPLYYPVGGFTFMVAAITVAIARPYKDSPYFIDIDVILFALVSTFGLVSRPLVTLPNWILTTLQGTCGIGTHMVYYCFHQFMGQDSWFTDYYPRGFFSSWRL